MASQQLQQSQNAGSQNARENRNAAVRRSLVNIAQKANVLLNNLDGNVRAHTAEHILSHRQLCSS